MQYEWSEVFMSLEGEGPYSGHPTAYVRLTKCNFTCHGFNNPEMKEITNEVLGYDPIKFVSLDDLPAVEIGCDSIYSWDKRFAHMWVKGTETDVANELLKVLPHNKWINPISGHDVILSLTGGEPTLRWKTLPTLLNHPSLADVKRVLIETNCSVAFGTKFVTELEATGKTIIWSNSPKLSVSGEDRVAAIRPDIARAQRLVAGSEQYFKFVCGPDESHFDEVERVMQYYRAGGNNDSLVYIMPMSCTEEQQDEIAMNVADMCIQRGFIYCHRIQNSIYKNAIGK